MGSIRPALAMAALLVAAACGGSGSDLPGRTATDGGGGGGEPSAAASPGPQAPAPAVAKVLDFKAPNLAGGQVVGSEFAGKDVAVWFWAPW